MARTVVRKNLVILPAVLILSMFLTTALAATKVIKVKNGGVIKIANGIFFEVEKDSLIEDTSISAELKYGDDYVDFEFGPDGTTFSEPAKLRIDLDVANAMDLDGLTLYGEDGEEIRPNMNKKYVEYEISHFSIYYYRRR